MRWIPRLAVPVALAALLLSYVFGSQAHAQVIDKCLIYALVALSLNAVIGYVGQLSLGHQGFVGLGAALSAYTATAQGLPFFATVLVGLGTGAAAALIMGLVALRVSGLYLALVTLVFGLTMQSSIFNISSLSGNGAGQKSNRPSFIQDSDQFFWLLVGVLVVVLYLDRQLTRSKAGRALAALKENERVAEAVGVDVTRYKLLAFTYSGAVAGLAGSLFAYNSQQFSQKDFDFLLALTFVAMTVVGGPGSRVGVVAGGAFFAALGTILGPWFGANSDVGTFIAGSDATQVPATIGAILLVLTLVLTPGGMAQLLDPVVTWVCGGRFSLARHDSGAGGVDGSGARA